MISGYFELQEARDAYQEAREEFRRDIARQTLDRSNRGRSVRMALKDLEKPRLNNGAPYDPKERWREAYRIRRAQDAQYYRNIAAFSRNFVDIAVKHLTEPRKIDALLGRPGI